MEYEHRKHRRHRKYLKAFNDTAAMRSTIPTESLQLFDQWIVQAENLHAEGRFQRSGLALHSARMLQPAFAQAEADKLRALGEAKVTAKRAAMGAFKVCTKCKKKRRRSSFHLQRIGLHGWEYRRSICKRCALALSKAWRKANPDQSEVHRKRAHARNNHRGHLKANFGLTPEEFERLHATSDGICPICKKPEQRKRRLSLDHDHATGRLRGLICWKCNLLLGHVNDSPELLEAAAKYLRLADLGVIITKGRSVPLRSLEEQHAHTAP